MTFSHFNLSIISKLFKNIYYCQIKIKKKNPLISAPQWWPQLREILDALPVMTSCVICYLPSQKYAPHIPFSSHACTVVAESNHFFYEKPTFASGPGEVVCWSK